jgi:hypothetical protein
VANRTLRADGHALAASNATFHVFIIYFGNGDLLVLLENGVRADHGTEAIFFASFGIDGDFIHLYLLLQVH